MKPLPVETIRLKNGLDLEIHDLSRKVAADRWRVEILASFSIPVDDRWFNPTLPAPADSATLRATLGEATRFEYRDQRNFIDEREKGAVFEAMRTTVKHNAQNYYSRPDFPARYLIRQFKSPARPRAITE